MCSSARYARGRVFPGGENPAARARLHEETIAREFLEEAGCEIENLGLVAEARQYVVSGGDTWNKLCRFYAVRVTRVAGPPIETDHEPKWIAREEAALTLTEEASRWALSLAAQGGRL
ncbi:MAG: NUDIX domain-containing protein [Alphaproteobacteria bacterium]